MLLIHRTLLRPHWSDGTSWSVQGGHARWNCHGRTLRWTTWNGDDAGEASSRLLQCSPSGILLLDEGLLGRELEDSWFDLSIGGWRRGPLGIVDNDWRVEWDQWHWVQMHLACSSIVLATRTWKHKFTWNELVSYLVLYHNIFTVSLKLNLELGKCVLRSLKIGTYASSKLIDWVDIIVIEVLFTFEG